MKLLKMIVFIFFIYLLRRFFQLYKAMKAIQARQEAELNKNHTGQAQKASEAKGDIIEADFKVIK